MLSYKEFYIWLEGYLHGKLEDKNIDITPIVEKMGQVKEETNQSVKITPFERIPIPVNPFPIQDDPYKPPFEVYCNDKQQLND
jgi:hypothetical protein